MLSHQNPPQRPLHEHPPLRRLITVQRIGAAAPAVVTLLLIVLAPPRWSPWLAVAGIAATALVVARTRTATQHLADDLAALSALCRDIDESWRWRGSRLAVDRRRPQELQQLIADFEEMAARLDGSSARLRQALEVGEGLRAELEEVLAHREEEIRERTEELQQANLDLERMARQDALTGIANHRRFVEFAEQCWRIGMREDRPVSILMIDIDHFKSYNDIYGHQGGDQALRAVAREIDRAARRPLDLAARYGGEEFAVVLGGVDLDEAVLVAEQTRRAVEALELVHSGSADYGIVTVSLGVACLVPQRDAELSTLISLADKALYRAKTFGRNRVERASGFAGR